MNQNIGPVARGWPKGMTAEAFVNLVNAASMPKDRIANHYKGNVRVS